MHLEIHTNTAQREGDIVARRQIVTARYIERGYIQPDNPFLSGGVYCDKYESTATPFVASIDDRVIASMRLIPNKPPLGLPINREPEIKIDKEWEEIVTGVPYEISQLASAKGVPSTKPVLALLRSLVVFAKEEEFKDVVAIVDSVLFRLVKNRLRLDIQAIGPSVNYMGSLSIPAYINIQQVIDNLRREHVTTGDIILADFFSTGQAPWYKGR